MTAFASARPVAAAFVLFAVACGGSTPPAEAPATPAPSAEGAAPAAASGETRPSCEAIDDACDAHEHAGGAAKECHDLAESKATSEAACAARKAECLAACPPKG